MSTSKRPPLEEAIDMQAQRMANSSLLSTAGTLCFQQIDIESYGERSRGEPVEFKLFGRTMEGACVVCTVDGYHPHFYVAIEHTIEAGSPQATDFAGDFRQSLLEALQQDSFPGHVLHDCSWTHKIDIFGFHPDDAGRARFLKLAFINQPAMNAAKRILENGAFVCGIYPAAKYNLYESNIPLVLKFMVDLGIYGMNWIEVDLAKCRSKQRIGDRIDVHVGAGDLVSHYPSEQWSKTAPLRILSFDIECVSKNKNQFPRPEQDPVIAIACITKVYGSGDGEYMEKRLFCLRSCAPIPDAIVSCYDSEYELMEQFSAYIRHLDPDVLVGYNILNFDFPYLVERANTLGCENFAYLGRLEGINASS